MHCTISNGLILYSDTKAITIPEKTPLGGAKVDFFAANIEDAINRGVKRLKANYHTGHAAQWIEFGWIDGGLSSVCVRMPIGALKVVNNCIYYHHKPFICGKESAYPDDPEIFIPFTGDNWRHITLALLTSLEVRKFPEHEIIAAIESPDK